MLGRVKRNLRSKAHQLTRSLRKRAVRKEEQISRRVASLESKEEEAKIRNRKEKTTINLLCH